MKNTDIVISVVVALLAAPVSATEADQHCMAYSVAMTLGSFSKIMKSTREQGMKNLYSQEGHPRGYYTDEINKIFDSGFDAGFSKGLPSKYEAVPVNLIIDTIKIDCVKEKWLEKKAVKPAANAPALVIKPPPSRQ